MLKTFFAKSAKQVKNNLHYLPDYLSKQKILLEPRFCRLTKIEGMF